MASVLSKQVRQRGDDLERALRAGPEEFKAILWPDVIFYDKQWEIIRSVQDVKETVVPAGNQLGKDFVSAFIVLWFFLTRNPCHIVTTSVKQRHLDVLWGEMRRFVLTSKVPLLSTRGGPLLVQHEQIRKVHPDGSLDPQSYIQAMVADDPESMSGHHATATSGEQMERWLAMGRPPLSMFVVDEASGVVDEYYRFAVAFAERLLIIGNPWQCSNFFYKAVKGDPAIGDRGGNLNLPTGRIVRQVIKISAEDSPNIRKARWQIGQGLEPTDEIVVPGIKTWGKYQEELVTKDKLWRCVSHSAEFPEDASVKLFPAEWLDHAELVAEGTDGRECSYCGLVHPRLEPKRPGRGFGNDSAAGGDNTANCVVDDLGLLDLRSHKTPDTSVIPSEALGMMTEWGVPPERSMFDYGGGGKQHVDYLRKQGYNVQAIMFGEAATAPLKRRGTLGTLPQRVGEKEERQAYKNRRAEMYAILSQHLDPMARRPFALPRGIMNRPRLDGGPSLRRQMELVQKKYTEEGVLFLPPKNKRPGSKTEQESLVSVIGCSPDEMDALVLAHFGLTHKAATTAVQVR